MAALGLICCSWTLSRCSEQGLLSDCSAKASHYSGFLVEHGLWGTQAP